jgi:hypothetical protein
MIVLDSFLSHKLLLPPASEAFAYGEYAKAFKAADIA